MKETTEEWRGVLCKSAGERESGHRGAGAF